MADESSMTLTDCLSVLKEVRQDEAIISVMGTAREWCSMSSHPLDFIYVPSSMGQATSLGLGIAMAQPNRRIVVCQGDGSMLMNLGSFVTLSAHAPKNLTVLLFDNGVYEVTGIQQTLATAELRQDDQSVNYAEMAKACGFSTVFEISDLDTWKQSARECLDADGPVFVVLKTEPMLDGGGPKSPGPAAQRIREFASALQAE